MRERTVAKPALTGTPVMSRTARQSTKHEGRRALMIPMMLATRVSMTTLQSGTGCTERAGPATRRQNWAIDQTRLPFVVSSSDAKESTPQGDPCKNAVMRTGVTADSQENDQLRQRHTAWPLTNDIQNLRARFLTIRCPALIPDKRRPRVSGIHQAPGQQQ